MSTSDDEIWEKFQAVVKLCGCGNCGLCRWNRLYEYTLVAQFGDNITDPEGTRQAIINKWRKQYENGNN